METIDQQNLSFNEQEFSLDISIGRLNDDGKTVKEKSIVPIPFDFTNKLTITNDLMEPFPVLTIDIKDPFGAMVTDFSEDGRSLIHLKCVFKQDQATIDLVFIITSVSLLSIESQQTILRISAISIVYPIWLGSMTYSSNASGGGKQKSATKIIEEIIQQIPLPLIKLKETAHSSQLLNFISPVNAQVNSCVNYLLNMAVSDADGIYYMSYDISQAKLQILSLKDLATSKDSILPFNGIKIATHLGFAVEDFSGNEIAYNVLTNAYINAIGVMDFNSETTLNEFSYLTRKWVKDNYTNTRLKNTQTPIKADDFQSTYITGKELPLFKDKKAKMKYELEPKNKFFLGSRLREFLRLNSNMRFTAKGYCKRNAGQAFKVAVDGPDTALYKKLAGTYIISRITHIFTKWKYEQIFDVVRPDRLSGLDTGEK